MMLKRSPSRERRRWKRHWFNGSIRVSAGALPIDGVALKVSEGGMYLFAVADLPVGTQIQVELTLPRSRELVQLDGTIRHRAVYLYGVEFVAESPALLDSASAQPY